MKKKGLNRLIVYLETAAVSVLSVVQEQREVLPMPAGIALYALAAVSVAAAAVCLYKDLREGVIDRILMTVKRSAPVSYTHLPSAVHGYLRDDEKYGGHSEPARESAGQPLQDVYKRQVLRSNAYEGQGDAPCTQAGCGGSPSGSMA